MKVEKELKNLGIHPIDSINIQEKDALIRGFSKMLFNTFPNVTCNYEQIAMKLYYCDMKRAIFNKEIPIVNYFYKNKTIYFGQKIPITINNENIIHECIHAIQDIRDENGNLKKIGLCELEEFRVRGMAFNEVVINWITSRVLNKEEKSIYIHNTQIQEIYNTPPYLYQILKQILYIVGEDVLVDSTLNGKEDFKEIFMKAINEEDFYYIVEDSFEKIIKLYEKIDEIRLKQKNINKKNKEIFQKEQEIENIFLKIQENLYIKYFNWLFAKIDTIEKTEEFKQKILEYKIYIIEPKNNSKYYKFMQDKLMKLDRKIIEINKRNTQNGLLIWKQNKLMIILQRLKELIIKEQ